jgi:hypothetical protein
MTRVAEDEKALKDLKRKHLIIESRLRVKYDNTESFEWFGNLPCTLMILLMKEQVNYDQDRKILGG